MLLPTSILIMYTITKKIYKMYLGYGLAVDGIPSWRTRHWSLRHRHSRCPSQLSGPSDCDGRIRYYGCIDNNRSHALRPARLHGQCRSAMRFLRRLEKKEDENGRHWLAIWLVEVYMFESYMTKQRSSFLYQYGTRERWWIFSRLTNT